MHKKTILLFAGVGVLSITSITGCKKNTKEDSYTKDGKLKISMRNLYFSNYQGGDVYLKDLEKQFQVKISFQPYSWANWETQVIGQVNGDSLPDVFHANIDSYNFANLYKFWAEEAVTKALPEDLSRWPNLEEMLNNISNIDALKINGKLYGIPIAKSTTDYSTLFSPFTYIYRRDWAKKYGVYQENDVYTWEQFENLLTVFSQRLGSDRYALGDVEWGYPSIVNFYKQVPHCFAFDDELNKYVNNYTTAEYIKGMKKAKAFYGNGTGVYYPAQNTSKDGNMNEKYCSNKIGVFFENLSYSNYVDIKKELKITNASLGADFNIDDATAIMKIKGPSDSAYSANRYVLEGTDNWFSMTFFDRKISTKKQEKILDILDWLLSKEGTIFSVFGRENKEYEMVDPSSEDYDFQVDDETKVKLFSDYWPKNNDGTYAKKENGAKYLRYLVSLGYDTLRYDPLTDKDAVNYLESWEQEMRDAYVADDPATPDVNEYLENSGLTILIENPEVRWLTTSKKATYSGQIRTKALQTVMKYIYNNGVNDGNYKSQFSSTWTEVLAEINKKLGYQ